MFPSDMSTGDAVFIAAFIAAVIAFVLLAKFLPKEDLGPDPDYSEKV